MADEKSCGAIVFTRENGIRKYVIIRGNGIYQDFCGFPKGHMEAGETEIQTALREIREETGLDVKILDGFRETDEHFLAREGRPNDKKTNVYFLAEYEGQEMVAQKSEVSETALMEYEDALRCLQSEESKRELEEAEKFLRAPYFKEIVESERLSMRRLMPEDYKAMAAWDMDERVYKYLLGCACKSPEEPLIWLHKKDPASPINILMLVSSKDDGHAVGIYAVNHELDRDVWTLSYVNRYDDWGKGYTVEGMRALMKHVAIVYGARSFEGECAKVNVGSAKVMEKLGMKYDHSSSYTKNDGSTTFESDVYTLIIEDVNSL